jgi:hypothetical protein
MNEVSLNKNQTDKFLKSWGSLYPRSGFLNQKLPALNVLALTALVPTRKKTMSSIFILSLSYKTD